MRLNFLFKGVFFLLARIHWVQPSCLELSPLQATNSAVNLNCPFNPVMERMMNTSSVEKSSYQVALMKTLRELLLGPLQEKSVTLIVSGLAKKLLNMDKILSYSKTPFILFEDETNQDKKNIKYYEKTMEFFSTSDEYSKVLELIDPNVPERRADKGLVTVYITEEHSPAYLMSPFSTSKMTSLLILSLDSECDVEELLQTPIAKQTSSLAIFCPVFNKNEARSAMVVTYRVFTWLPFHPDHMMVSLGQWSLTSFPAWEDLFIDRFASLYGMTLHVSGDVEDRPFFFQHEDETFDGTSVRMMDALGKWMDFKYTLTENASDYQWGECENGSWVGMLGDIWREEKDMAINSLTITEKRARDFDYTFPHFIEG
ncbi:hypothetical protein SK128_001427 [Halocaridina rubra]|uniref:Ionotropic glutamate receptor L-glutamate and glycine-binding domain-containing protein n=1 Tax=Halocaridina rubra TaxID=373956 RepID=A0AAN9A744_HALRR